MAGSPIVILSFVLATGKLPVDMLDESDSSVLLTKAQPTRPHCHCSSSWPSAVVCEAKAKVLPLSPGNDGRWRRLLNTFQNALDRVGLTRRQPPCRPKFSELRLRYKGRLRGKQTPNTSHYDLLSAFNLNFHVFQYKYSNICQRNFTTRKRWWSHYHSCR